MSREAAPWHGAHWLPTHIAKPKLHVGGVRQSDEENGRDGRSCKMWRGRPSGLAAAGKSGMGGFEIIFVPREPSDPARVTCSPSIFQHPLSHGIAIAIECGPGLVYI
jgi:hypothetical protein